MSGKPATNRVVRDEHVKQLVALEKENGHLSPADYREHAAKAGYSARQLRRCVAAVKAPNDPGFIVDQVVGTVVAQCHGNIAKAHRRLTVKGHAVPPLRTFSRAVSQALGTDQVAYLREGSESLRRRQIYLRMDQEARTSNYELDHSEMPIWVVPKGHTHAVKPWITGVLDSATGVLVSWVITFGTPNAEQIRASLIEAITVRPTADGTLIGGRPDRCTWDRGKDFLGELPSQACDRLDIDTLALPGYTPHLKPRIERIWGFMQDDCLSHLPGYINGRRDLRGATPRANYAMGEDEFVTEVETWVEWYHTCHRVRTRNDMTPLELWKADDRELDEVPLPRLVQDFLIGKPVKVSKNGVRHRGQDYIGEALAGLVGRTVEVRHLPHDGSYVEVFHDGRHIGTAWPATDLTSDQRQNVLVVRQERRQQAITLARKGDLQARREADAVHRLHAAKKGPPTVSGPAHDQSDASVTEGSYDDLPSAAAALAQLTGSKGTPTIADVAPTTGTTSDGGIARTDGDWTVPVVHDPEQRHLEFS